MGNHVVKLLAFSVIVAMTTSTFASSNLISLSDDEMAAETGQALLSLGYTAPSGTTGGLTDYGYYKLGMEAKVEMNLNIKNLQLGCGGRNGPGVCDIDMSNVSLSGPADGKVNSANIAENGTPAWSTGRPSTSAVMTNPFIEFAIKNPTSASTREVMGFRLSAEDVLGYLSAGTANVANPTDGIKTFSGFIKVAQTPVNAFTNPAMFGTTKDQMIYAKITALGIDRSVTTNPNAMTPGSGSYETPGNDIAAYVDPVTGQKVWGINVAKQPVNFNFPETIVTGNRMSQLNLVVKDVPIPTIAIGAADGALRMRLDQSILGLANDPLFFMGAEGTSSASCAANYNTSNCSYITNLKANVTVKQNFNLIHNLPISSGAYLSLQKEAMKWPGSDSADIAQPGWWLSFKDPLDFGALNPTSGIPMQDVLPQIATYVTDYLSQNNIDLGFGEALGAAVGAPIYKGIGNIQLANDARAVMVLENLLLDGNQKPVPNCYGSLTFC